MNCARYYWLIRRTPYKRPYKVNAQSHTSAHFYAGDIGHHICTTHTMRLACGQASQWLSCSRNDSQKARGAQRLPARRWLHPARRWCTTRAHTGAPHAPTRSSPSTVVSLRWCVRVLTAVKVWVQIDGAELLRRARARLRRCGRQLLSRPCHQFEQSQSEKIGQQ